MVKKLKILLVDDEPTIRFIFQKLFDRILDIDYKICASGKMALAEYKDYKPDVFFIDVMLPDITGYEILESIDDKSKKIMISAKIFTNKDKKHFEKYNVYEYLEKPFKQTEVVKLIETLKNELR